MLVRPVLRRMLGRTAVPARTIGGGSGARHAHRRRGSCASCACGWTPRRRSAPCALDGTAGIGDPHVHGGRRRTAGRAAGCGRSARRHRAHAYRCGHDATGRTGVLKAVGTTGRDSDAVRIASYRCAISRPLPQDRFIVRDAPDDEPCRWTSCSSAAGPAGLAGAIELAKLVRQDNENGGGIGDVEIAVLEKAGGAGRTHAVRRGHQPRAVPRRCSRTSPTPTSRSARRHGSASTCCARAARCASRRRPR
jgi:hypothetical protein